ncbi:MAG: sugar phosphate isomerase/epimerase [Clostridia bacterium]|nr:sugar phosphate isomerase/epimerase [Clostridia bacterium]
MTEYGLQLYSVRDLTKDDFSSALKQVAEMGYKFVEPAGFFGHSAEDVVAMLKEYGLKLSGTHSSLKDLDENFAETIKYHQAIGNKNYIIPGAPYTTAAETAVLVEKLNKYKEMLAKEGITLAYHNHDGEFKPNKDGQIVHEILQKETDIDFEIDTYWAFCAGLDPVETITKLKDRVHVIHLKDGTRDRKGLSLGLGEAPVTAVRAKAMELGMKMVVESEGCDPTGIEEVKRCIEFLKGLEK